MKTIDKKQLSEVCQKLELAISENYKNGKSDIKNLKHLIVSCSSKRELTEKITNLIPDYSVEGIRGATFPENKATQPSEAYENAVATPDIVVHVNSEKYIYF